MRLVENLRIVIVYIKKRKERIPDEIIGKACAIRDEQDILVFDS
jgi:hypothetical protein